MNAIVLPVVLPLLAAFLLQPLERLSGFLARLLGPLTLLVCVVVIWQVWSRENISGVKGRWY